MQVRDLILGSIIICIIFTYKSDVVVAEQIVECVHSKEDYLNSGWVDRYGYWAKDSSELPGEFKDNLVGQYEDVHYYYNATVFVFTLIYNEFLIGNDTDGPAYLYLKYYAPKNSNGYGYRFSAYEGLYYLAVGSDYVWDELLIRLGEPDNYVGIDVGQWYNNTLFFDTFIYTKGKEYNVSTDMEAVKALCPQTGISTSTVPTTTVVTTEIPNDPYFICVDTQEDFENHWQSYPFHDYVTNSSQLPGDLEKLGGNGIFYLEGSNSFQKMSFIKNFRNDPDWNVVPTYLYIKYYSHIWSNDSQRAYVRPAFLVPGDHIQKLPPGKIFNWDETILQIEGEEKIIEIGVDNFQINEFFLVDKIAVARSNYYVTALKLILSCADK